MTEMINRAYTKVEDVANAGLDFFFKFKYATLRVFMWMCIICTALSLNIFTGALAFFIYFYLKREKASNITRKRFEIKRKK